MSRRRPLAALRRTAAAAAIGGGLALVAVSVSGISGLDGTLAAEAERERAAARHVLVSDAPRPQRDCPPPERRHRQQPPPVTTY